MLMLILLVRGLHRGLELDNRNSKALVRTRAILFESSLFKSFTRACFRSLSSSVEATENRRQKNNIAKFLI